MYVRYCKNSMIFLRVVSYNASRAPGFFLPRPGQFIFRQIQTCGGWFQHRDGGYGSTIRHRLTYRIRRYWTLEPSIFLGDLTYGSLSGWVLLGSPWIQFPAFVGACLPQNSPGHSTPSLSLAGAYHLRRVYQYVTKHIYHVAIECVWYMIYWIFNMIWYKESAHYITYYT